MFFGLEPNQKNWQNGGACLSINIGNKIKFNSPLHFLMGARCSGLKKTKKLMEKRAPQNECFIIHFIIITSTIVG